MAIMMTRRSKHLAACIGLAAMLALQVAVVAHGMTLPAAASPAQAQPSGIGCSGMAANGSDDNALHANLCAAHCQAGLQIDNAIDVVMAAPTDRPALRVGLANEAMPASAWLEPRDAKGTAPPAQLLYVRFLI